jgi:hypothetical protein
VNYLTTEELAVRLHVTPRSVSAYIAKDLIPYRKQPGIRRVLVPEPDFLAFMDGAELEVIYPPSGGKVVRPK